MSRISTYTDIELGLYEAQSITVIQKQGDDESRYIRVLIVDNDGKELDLTNCFITFSMLTSKNTGFLYSSMDADERVVVEDNKVVVRLNKNMLTDSGIAKAEIIVARDGAAVSSTKFDIYIEPNVNQDGASSMPEYKALIDILEYGSDVEEWSRQATESAANAKISEENAKTSEDNAKTSETNAKASETNAKTSETNAKSSETNAKTSEDNAKTSETNAKASETKAATSETNAKTSETNADASATLSKSYAVGGTGTRTGEDTDNSKYFYEQAKAISKVQIATSTTPGIVKPDNVTVIVENDGTIKVTDVGTEISQADYDALPEDKKNKGVYWIYDAD